MNFSIQENALRKNALLALLIVMPAFAAAQHKNAPAPHSAPAPSHASAPSRPAQSQHQAPPSHQNAGGGGRPASNSTAHQGGSSNNRPGNSNAGGANSNRPGGGNSNRPGNTNSNRPAGANNTRPGNANSNRPGGANSNRPGNANNNRPGGANNNRPGSANANRPGGANGRPGAGGNRAANHTPPGRQVALKGGGSAHIRPNGQIRTVNRNGMQIQHGMHGGRTVVATRNGARVVTVGRRGGYVQRAYVTRGGRSYYSRTYYYHGAYRSGVYRGYYYGGRPYYGYYPAYYYRPAYYGWAYNPWPAPAPYAWGWGGAPWYGYYGPYYQPYPVYPSAAFWLTDFMLAATLQAAYEAQNASLLPIRPDGTLVASLAPMAASGAETAKLSPEVKNELSEEVKAALASEQEEAGKGKAASSSGGGQPAQSTEAPPALNPKFRTFMVSSDLSLVADGGDECGLSEGDVITRTTETPDDDGNVNVKVVASTKSDCAVGTEGPLSTDDLQEMYNHFREQLKDGMGELAKKQGTGGLPKAPDTTTVDGDVPAPPPDKNASKTLEEQQNAADQTESEVKQEAASGGGN